MCRERRDAAHIVWNFAHMVAISAKRKLERTIESLGYSVPLLVKPEEILLEIDS